MDKVDYIKMEITKLYKINPNIHISVRSTRPKVVVESAPAVITGVYRNIFQVEENDGGRPTRHTFQYADVLIGHVIIEELDYAPVVKTSNKK